MRQDFDIYPLERAEARASLPHWGEFPHVALIYCGPEPDVERGNRLPGREEGRINCLSFEQAVAIAAAINGVNVTRRTPAEIDAAFAARMAAE